MKNTTTLIFRVLLLYLFFLVAFFFQLQPIPVERLDTGMGLSNNIVYDVYQDSLGFVWVATENGLNRYDAYQFDTFYHDPNDSTTISSNVVRCIIEDNDYSLWIGTNKGLNRFDRRTGQFHRFQQIPGYDELLLDIQSLYLDNQGFLWFGTPDHGVWQFDPKELTFNRIAMEWGHYRMNVDADGVVWIQSFDPDTQTNMLSRFNTSTNRFEKRGLQKAETPYFPVHFSKHSKKTWADKNLQHIQAFNDVSVIPDLPGDLEPIRVLEDQGGKLWLGTETSGLFVYDPLKDHFNHLMLTPGVGSLGNYVRQLYEDRQGAIWVGTRNGLFRIDPHRKPFHHMDPTQTVSENTEGSIIMSMAYADDRLWLGIFSEGLYYLEPVTSQLTKYELASNETTDHRNLVNQVWSISQHPSDANILWVGTSDGLYRTDIRSGLSRRIDLPYRQVAAPVIFSIIKGDRNSIWVAGDENVYRIDIHSGRMMDRVNLESRPNLSTIQALYLHGNRYLIIGTVGIGLLVYDTTTGHVSPFTEDSILQDMLANTSIWSIHKGVGNSIWMSTGNGLYRLDMAERRVISIQETDQNSRSLFYSVLANNSGQVWLGTDRGLAVYHPAENRFRYYNTNDGIVNTEFNRRAALITPDGRHWFGGINGLTWFDPTLIGKNLTIPPVHITSIDIFSRNGQRTVNPFQQQKLDLTWKENTLEIHFTALNFTSPGQNKYRYRLQNHETDWVDAHDRRFVRYTQLPAGNYRFQVQASNNDDVWNLAGASLPITVSPPFWQTFWFKTLIFLFISALLWFLYRYRIKKIIEMERMRLRIAGDLHDEIGSGLSGIALSGDLLHNRIKQDAAQSELVRRITHNARELATSLDTIVWLVDPQKDTLIDFVTRCKTTANELLEGLVVHYHIDIPEESFKYPMSGSYRRNLFLLYKEALHNVVRHAQAHEVRIEMKVTHTKNLQLSIRDDGKGFDPDSATGGNGLDNLRHRAESLGSDLKIQSSPGSGSLISLEVKLP